MSNFSDLNCQFIRPLMAHSPTLPSATLPGFAGPSNTRYRPDRLSVSPQPLQHISKREKRRIAMSDRLADLSTTFAENRDAIYRKQLQVFQADIHYINSAALYSNKCLEEYGDEQTQDGNVSAAASIHGGLRTIQQAQSNGASATLKTGRHTASFIEDVNDAMEQRDADLLTIAVRPFTLLHSALPVGRSS